MFHSFGIVQSNTFWPVRNSLIFMGAISINISSVFLLPSPVILRVNGNSLLRVLSISFSMFFFAWFFFFMLFFVSVNTLLHGRNEFRVTLGDCQYVSI